MQKYQRVFTGMKRFLVEYIRMVAVECLSGRIGRVIFIVDSWGCHGGSSGKETSLFLYHQHFAINPFPSVLPA